MDSIRIALFRISLNFSFPSIAGSLALAGSQSFVSTICRTLFRIFKCFDRGISSVGVHPRASAVAVRFLLSLNDGIGGTSDGPCVSCDRLFLPNQWLRTKVNQTINTRVFFVTGGGYLSSFCVVKRSRTVAICSKRRVWSLGDGSRWRLLAAGDVEGFSNRTEIQPDLEINKRIKRHHIDIVWFNGCFRQRAMRLYYVMLETRNKMEGEIGSANWIQLPSFKFNQFGVNWVLFRSMDAMSSIFHLLHIAFHLLLQVQIIISLKIGLTRVKLTIRHVY